MWKFVYDGNYPNYVVLCSMQPDWSCRVGPIIHSEVAKRGWDVSNPRVQKCVEGFVAGFVLNYEGEVHAFYASFRSCLRHRLRDLLEPVRLRVPVRSVFLTHIMLVFSRWVSSCGDECWKREVRQLLIGRKGNEDEHEDDKYLMELQEEQKNFMKLLRHAILRMGHRKVSEGQVGGAGSGSAAFADYYTEELARLVGSPLSEDRIRAWYPDDLLSPIHKEVQTRNLPIPLVNEVGPSGCDIHVARMARNHTVSDAVRELKLRSEHEFYCLVSTDEPWCCVCSDPELKTLLKDYVAVLDHELSRLKEQLKSNAGSLLNGTGYRFDEHVLNDIWPSIIGTWWDLDLRQRQKIAAALGRKNDLRSTKGLIPQRHVPAEGQPDHEAKRPEEVLIKKEEHDES